MSRNYRDDPNKVPLGDRRPWPSSSNVETGISSGGSLLNPSYLSGLGGGSGKESSSSAGNGNTSFSSIPSKFSQEFQSRWSSCENFDGIEEKEVFPLPAEDEDSFPEPPPRPDKYEGFNKLPPLLIPVSTLLEEGHGRRSPKGTLLGSSR